MSRQKPSWKSDQSWRDRPSPVHDERMEREMKRGVANEKRREITSFPIEDVVAVAEFVSNLKLTAQRAVKASEDAARDADDDKDAAFHQAEAQTWRGRKMACEMIESGSTVFPL